MARNSEQSHTVDVAYLNSFRNAAAGLIKSLILARARSDPTFLAPEEFRRWGIKIPSTENRSCAQLLIRVRQLYDRLVRKFLQDQDSIAVPVSAEDADNFDSPRESIASFIYVDLIENCAVIEPTMELAPYDVV
ncbi:MAG: hypothetical protein WD738_22245 [Pirellulales bacterium]